MSTSSDKRGAPPPVVIVTGGSGKVGRAVCRDLAEHGYRTLNLDLAPPATPQGAFAHCDLTDFGAVMGAFTGIDASPLRPLLGGSAPIAGIVHMGAIPGPGRHPDAEVFRVNTLSTYNVFSAAARLGIARVVWASSETLLGLPLDAAKIPYVPLDEAVDRPEWSYALAKSLGEHMARDFVRWHPRMTILGLRFSNVMEPHDYAGFGAWQGRPGARIFNLWGYVDARDCAQACRLALTAPVSGADSFIVAAADTVMDRPSRELMAEVLPNVPIRGALEGRQSLLSIDKARRILGYEPRYSWRDP
ncbi:MAG: NAD-dependent epimerase/dehydratase family protein [Gammaproteobacteria bacterium]